MPCKMIPGFPGTMIPVTFWKGASKVWKAQQEQQNFGETSKIPFCFGLRAALQTKSLGRLLQPPEHPVPGLIPASPGAGEGLVAPKVAARHRASSLIQQGNPTRPNSWKWNWSQL